MEDVAACFRRCSGLLLESWSGWKAPFWPARASLRWPAGELQPSLAQDVQQKGRGVSLVLQWGSAGRMSPQRGLCPADAHLLPQTDTSALSQAVPRLSWSQASFARACPMVPSRGVESSPWQVSYPAVPSCRHSGCGAAPQLFAQGPGSLGTACSSDWNCCGNNQTSSERAGAWGCWAEQAGPKRTPQRWK